MLNKNTAFTLTELIMIVVIISIIALTTSAIVLFFMQNTIFLPSQMNVQQIADVAMDMMIEGDDNAKGLRFARITEIADNKVVFTSAEPESKNVILEWDSATGIIKRTIDGVDEGPIPYYATGDITVLGEEDDDGVNKLFHFFDETEGPAATAADVRRVEIKLIAKSGTGEFDDWEGKVALGSSVKLYIAAAVNQLPTISNLIATPSTIPRTGQSTITFDVDDPDGGQVSWAAALSGSAKGTLSQTSGTAGVPYNVSIIYTPGKFGSATVTITLDDGSGGTFIDSRDITVTK